MEVLPLSNSSAPNYTLPLSIGQVAERRLRESPYFYLRSLSCDYRDGRLTLRGRVPFSRLKQFAEAIVARVAGVEEVVNRVEVIDPAQGYRLSKGA